MAAFRENPKGSAKSPNAKSRNAGEDLAPITPVAQRRSGSPIGGNAAMANSPGAEGEPDPAPAVSRPGSSLSGDSAPKSGDSGYPGLDSGYPVRRRPKADKYGLQKTSINLPVRTRDALERARLDQDGISFSELANRALVAYLRKEGYDV